MLDSLLGAMWLVLLCLSFAGYALYLYSKAGLEVHFIPVVLFCGIVCFLFVGSLVHLLLPAALLVLAAGLDLLMRCGLGLAKQKGLVAAGRAFVTPGLLLFLAVSIFFLVYMRGGRLMIGDSFSHWGLMAEYLHRYNALPDASTTMITYQSYPPGSALFIYYITLFFGHSESRMLWAQLVFTLAGLCVLFAVAKGKHPVLPVLAAAGAFCMLAGGWSIFDLLVDTLYPVLGFAGTAVILHYRRQPGKAAAFSAPISVACTLVKNSGLLFGVINGLLVLYLLWRAWRAEKVALADAQVPANGPMVSASGGNSKSKAQWSMAVTMLLAITPVLALLLWNLHVDLAYPAGDTSKHAMRADNIGQGLAEKRGDMAVIAGRFLGQTVTLKNHYTAVLLVWNAAFIALAVYHARQKDARAGGAIKTLLFADGVWALYMTSLLAVYLTTMPLEEALDLASYGRYCLTISVYLCGVFAWVLLGQARAILAVAPPGGDKRRATVPAGLLAVCLCAALLLTARPAGTFRRREYHGTLFEVIDTQTAILEDRTDQYSYFVVGPADIEGGGVMANTGGYIRYKLWVSAYDVRTPQYIEENSDWFLEQQQKYAMLLILEDTPFIHEYMQQYPQYAGRESYVGLYNLPLW